MRIPYLIVTSDVDWASEALIEKFCNEMLERAIRPTLFATHRSEVLRRYIDDDLIDIGIHPNCFAGSDQGDSYDEILRFLIDLYPEALVSRSHGYFDNSRFAASLAACNIGYDSNTCQIGLSDIFAFRMWNGIVRLPVFWEDDIHWTQGLPFILDDIFKESLRSPGLKVIDVHPFHYGFNIDGEQRYNALKGLTKAATPADIVSHRNAENGVGSFLSDLLAYAEQSEIVIGSFKEWQSQHVSSAARSPFAEHWKK